MALNLREYAATIRLTDGATGTQLAKLGLSPGSASELWNVTNAAAVEQVARSYIKAGSDIILTNTLCANRYMMAAHGLTGRAAELAEAGVLVARRAAAATTREVKVFASLGPTGKIVMTEELAPEEFISAFAEAAEALAFGGADAIVLETFNELEEARLATLACKSATDLPVIVCLTFSSGPDKTRTMMGNSPEELAKMARTAGADAIGANCGAGPETYVKVAQLLRAASDLPLWMKPNAGLPTMGKDGRSHFPMSPAEFASYVPTLVEAGAGFVGGCCGTGPGHIEAVRREVDKLAGK